MASADAWTAHELRNAALTLTRAASEPDFMPDELWRPLCNALSSPHLLLRSQPDSPVVLQQAALKQQAQPADGQDPWTPLDLGSAASSFATSTASSTGPGPAAAAAAAAFGAAAAAVTAMRARPSYTSCVGLEPSAPQVAARLPIANAIAIPVPSPSGVSTSAEGGVEPAPGARKRGLCEGTVRGGQPMRVAAAVRIGGSEVEGPSPLLSRAELAPALVPGGGCSEPRPLGAMLSQALLRRRQ